jgi:dTDP-4-amino-4,6-dideoxygalactose transaminase
MATAVTAPGSAARIALGRPSITDAELAAAQRVLESRWLVLGAENRAFEEELAAYCGRRYAAALSSGTAALHLALHAMLEGAPANHDAILVPAFTFPATANIARFLPGQPEVVLGDVTADSFCLDARLAASWLSAGRGPCILVHQFGHPAPWPEATARGSDEASPATARPHDEALILSDAACAIGVPGAMRGRAICLSFHPRKLLTTGEGGAVLSDDLGLIEEVRARRAHGLQARPASPGAPSLPGENIDLLSPGLNYRLPELGAAIGRAQLQRLPSLIARHRQIAERYRERLSGYGLTFQTDHSQRIYQTFAVVLPAGCDRSALRRQLAEAGIETQVASYALQHLSAYSDAKVLRLGGSLSPYQPGDLTIASELHHRGLALPLHSELSDADVDRVSTALLSALRL